ncbi:sulfatase [Planctomycetota bacterium]
MTKLLLFGLSVICLLSGMTIGNPQETSPKPNVIYIFPDQFRLYSLGFWSQPGQAQHIQGNPDPVVTPALDKLANEGIVFSHAVSNFPLCSPYRGMLMTGMSPEKNGLTTNCHKTRSIQLRTDATCITDVFSQAGYHVSYFGKCHWQRTEPLFDVQGNYVGSKEAPGGHYMNAYDTYVPPGPDRHSIDYFFQAAKDVHFDPRCYSNDPQAVGGLQDGELYRPKQFSAEVESERIMDYLSNTRAQRDADKPFFLIWSLNPPHNPWTEESTYMEFFPPYAQPGKELLTRANADAEVGDYAPYYFANVSAVDHFIGKVLGRLEELGLTDNTIVVFSSDHGEMLGSHGDQGKNVPEIESYAIPFIVKWNQKLSHRVEDMILSVPDIMPTLLGLAGLETKIPEAVQGTNYSSLLWDPDSTAVTRAGSALYYKNHSRGLYTGKYMFVVNEEEGKFKDAFCYDNEKDPYQLTKLSVNDMNPRTVKGLKTELLRLLQETEDSWFQKGICREFLLKE